MLAGVVVGNAFQSGSFMITPANVWETSSPAKACLPVSISKSRAPNDQISQRRSTVFPRLLRTHVGRGAQDHALARRRRADRRRVADAARRRRLFQRLG